MTPSLKTRLSTPRLQETRNWYARVFSREALEEWDEPGDRGVILAFPGGHAEALLEIYHDEASRDFSGLSLQLRVGNLAAFKEGLADDVQYEGPAARPWGSSYLYLRDPNGIRVVVYEGGY